MRLHLLAVICLSPLSPAMAQTVPHAPQPSQNSGSERICQDVKLTGSRLAVKRFCGTRAEWADKRMQDRHEVERIQRSPCVRDGSTCK